MAFIAILFALIVASQCRNITVSNSKDLLFSFQNAEDFDYIYVEPGEYVFYITIDSKAKFVNVIGKDLSNPPKFVDTKLGAYESLIKLNADLWGFRNINFAAGQAYDVTINGNYNLFTNCTMKDVIMFGNNNELRKNYLGNLFNSGTKNIIYGNEMAPCYSEIPVLNDGGVDTTFINNIMKSNRWSIKTFVEINGTNFKFIENTIEMTYDPSRSKDYNLEYFVNLKSTSKECSISDSKFILKDWHDNYQKRLKAAISNEGRQNKICVSNSVSNGFKLNTDSVVDQCC